MDALIKEFSVKHDINGCFSARWQRQFVFFNPKEDNISDLMQTQNLVQFYLFPASLTPDSLEDVSPKLLRWTTVHPGKIWQVNDTSILTPIVFSTFNIGKYRPLPWLKSILKTKGVIFGATATNVVLGGSTFYSTIAYSPGALLLFNEGVAWKYETKDRVLVKP